MQLSLGNLSYDNYSKKIKYPIYNQNENDLRVKLPEMLLLSQENNILTLEIKDEDLIRDIKQTFDTIDTHIKELLMKKKEFRLDKIKYIGMNSLIISESPSFIIQSRFHPPDVLRIHSSKTAPVIVINKILINSHIVTVNMFME